MRDSHRWLVFLVVAAVASVFSPPVQGNTIAFHKYLAQQHAETTALPRLHGRIPAHVPHFTNEGAIHFWAHTQHNAILRNSAFEIQLCQAVTAHRNLNPGRFDHYHPRMGHLLRDSQFFDYALHLYYTHPSRFVHYHHHLVPLIRGCAMLMNMTPPSATAPEVLQNPGSNNQGSVPGAISNGPGPVGPGPVGPGPVSPGEISLQNLPPAAPAAIPAPPSIVLMFFGISYVATRVRRARAPISV